MKGCTVKQLLRKFPIYTEVDGEEVETLYDIECNLTPEEPEVRYLKNGDPGHPGSPPECEIVSIKINGKEVPPELWEKIGLDDRHREQVEEEAFELANNPAEPPERES